MPEAGLDCVGVVAWVHRLVVPTGYRLRCSRVELIADWLRLAGFVAGDGAAGDVVVLRPGAAQVHLGVVTAGGFVHADAGLGRVVESPWRADWDVVGFWRPLTPLGCAESPSPARGEGSNP